MQILKSTWKFPKMKNGVQHAGDGKEPRDRRKILQQEK
jgi:hypothetical protein